VVDYKRVLGLLPSESCSCQDFSDILDPQADFIAKVKFKEPKIRKTVILAKNPALR
jgi:hypothetical protein